MQALNLGQEKEETKNYLLEEINDGLMGKQH